MDEDLAHSISAVLYHTLSTAYIFLPFSPQIDKQNVWITCEGENPNDFENIGKVNYYPHPGMPAYFYPFTNQPGYQAPLVAVEFASVKRESPPQLPELPRRSPGPLSL